MMSDEERREVVSLETWLNKQDIVYSCQCREVDSNGFLQPRYVYSKIRIAGKCLADIDIFSSPEPKAQGELIVWDSSWCPSVHTFKH